MDNVDLIDPFNEGIDKGKNYPMLVLTNKKLLLDTTFSDLTIKTGGDTVLAHAAIVSARCEEIIPFNQDEKSKKRKKHEVKLRDGTVKNGPILQRVLEYLYTGIVDFPKMTDEDILHLNVAAKNLNLPRLNYLCERWLKEHLRLDNVFHLLKAATDLKEERVKGYGLGFALEHYTDFISNKDGIYILGIELFQEVVAAFTSKPTVEDLPPCPPDTLLQDFKRLYDSIPYSDCMVSVDGETIKCHKAILAAHSDLFSQQLVKADSLQEKISNKAFRHMLKFMYYGDDDVEALPACELVPFSRRYKLHSLLRICEDKIRHSVSVPTVIEILSIAYLPAEGKQDLCDELKKKCFPFILSHLTEIDITPIKMLHPMISLDLLFELQDAWKKGEHNLGFSIGYDSGKNNNAPNINNNNNNNNNNIEVKEKSNIPNSSSSFSLGAQRNRNQPPPQQNNVVPSPPPREKPPSLPPPSIGTPPPSIVTPKEKPNDILINSNNNNNNNSSSNVSEVESSSGSISSSGGKPSKKDKKEEDKRKKEEAKRIAKEKKERAKMEKKFKAV